MRALYFTIILLLFATIGTGSEWEIVSEMPNPVFSGQAVVHDSLIYILGGIKSKNNQINFSEVIQVYDPIENRWYTERGLVNHRYGFVADIYKDEVFSCCGTTRGFFTKSSIEHWDFLNAPEIYNYNYNFNRRFATGHIFEDNYYLFGGFSAMSFDSAITAYSIAYNIPTATATELEDSLFFGEFPFHQMSVLHGSDIYLLGGNQFNISNKVIKFNCLDNSFMPISTSLLNERAGGDAVVMNNGDIYIIGGYSERELALSSVDIFSIHPTHSCQPGPSMNYPRTELMAVLFENSIYVFGGVNLAEQAVAAVEKYTIMLADVPKPKNLNRIVKNFELKASYPNPFNAGFPTPQANISFIIRKVATARLEIYSLLGQHIKTVANRRFAPGEYTFQWNGNDQDHHPVASGIYIYRLTTEKFSASKKMLLAR